ncbi:MAG: DUF3052 domain-containing protein [Burkholderiaceae bacterium]|jgi:hypothetical protein
MTSHADSGYSGRPLAEKLGVKAGHQVLLVNAPAEYRDLLGPVSEHVKFLYRLDAGADLAHVFVTRHEELSKLMPSLRKELGPAAIVWVSWPKKSSNVPSTVTDEVIREIALPLGFVDVKVCAVTHVWSALKLVVRKELR